MVKKLFLVFIALAGLCFAAVVARALMPVHAGRNPRPVVIEVEKGESVYGIVMELREGGIVLDPRLFSALARITGADKKIKAGRHRIYGKQNMLQVLESLQSIDISRNCFTVPEGFTAQRIAQLLQEKGLADKEKFMALVNDGPFAVSMGITMGSFEGYLFPETYCVGGGESEAEIITMMHGQFRKIFDEDLQKGAETAGLTVHKVVTLASIIEKEAGADEEKPLVSAVFHNRLKRGMPLQSCATVIYALGDYYDGNLTKEHLEYDSPYNTYVHTGLPPGPVSNPGLASLRAAVNPAEVDYLYFVSMNDGRHKFSSTIDEHNSAVLIYQVYPQ